MSRKSELKAIEEQNLQDAKWKDYRLEDGFKPNKTYLIMFQILQALIPAAVAITLILLTVLPICAGQSLTSFVVDVFSCSGLYRVRGIISVFIVMGVVQISVDAAARVAESLSFDFAGVKKREIRGAILSFLLVGALPVVVAVIGEKYVSLGNFGKGWAIPMAAASFVNLVWIITESVLRSDKKKDDKEEPSEIYKNFVSVYGNYAETNKKKINVIRELLISVLVIAVLVVQFVPPFVSQQEFLTEERVAQIEDLENPDISDVCAIMGTPAVMVAQDGAAIYVFYGTEMNRTFFNENNNPSLSVISKYAEEKNKVIPFLIVETEDNQVTYIMYYENIAEDVDLDFDFGF